VLDSGHTGWSTKCGCDTFEMVLLYRNEMLQSCGDEYPSSSTISYTPPYNHTFIQAHLVVASSSSRLPQSLIHSLILAPHHLNNLLHPLTPHPLKPIHSHSKSPPPARQRSQMLQIPNHLLQRNARSNSPHPIPALAPSRNSSATRRALERIRRRINSIDIHHRPVSIRQRRQRFRVGSVEGQNVPAARGRDVMHDGAEAGFVDGDGDVHHGLHHYCGREG
jgi:hypothetical protein